MREFGCFLAAVGFAWFLGATVDSDRARFAILVFLVIYNFASLRDEFRGISPFRRTR